MIVRGQEVPTPECLCHGPCQVDTSIPAVERFIKDEITLMKTCGCAHCDYRRQMFRAMQYIINEYKKHAPAPNKYPACNYEHPKL